MIKPVKKMIVNRKESSAASKFYNKLWRHVESHVYLKIAGPLYRAVRDPVLLKVVSKIKELEND